MQVPFYTHKHESKFKHNILISFIFFTVLASALSSIAGSSVEISDSKRRMFEGFSSDPRTALHKVQRQIEGLHQEYKKASEVWYSLHLLSEENWLEQLELWPNGQSFKEYIQQSLVVSTKSTDSTHQNEYGFLAFHRLPEYEPSLHFYENPEKINFATGLELLDEDEQKFQPLSKIQTKNFLDLYHHIDGVLETLTQIRLEIEILRDQIVALDFEKENGYYVRHLSNEARSTISHLADDVDSLFIKIKDLRTHKLLPTHDLATSLVYATNYAAYPTTTEFKTDVYQLVSSIKQATPHLSEVERAIQSLVKKLASLQERDGQVKNYTREQFETLKDKVTKIFSELSDLALQEQNEINGDSSVKKQKWLKWFEKNHSRYTDLFYQLYEILEYQTQPGTDIYEFQTEVFHVDSINRQLYRNLEALMFGTMNHSQESTNIKASHSGLSPQSVAKYRSSIVHRILNLQSQNNQKNCAQLLNFL